jgi:hypothetical protein
MAIFKPGTGIAAISGSFGATTFKTCPSRNLITQRRCAAYAATAKQLKASSVLDRVQWNWQHLTFPQRAAWRAHSALLPHPAHLGTNKQASGQALYTAYNCILVGAGSAPMDNPPGLEVSTSILELTPEFTEGGPYDIIPAASGNAYTNQYVWFSRPYSAQLPPRYCPHWHFIGGRSTLILDPDWFYKFEAYGAEFVAGEVIMLATLKWRNVALDVGPVTHPAERPGPIATATVTIQAP